MTRDNQAEGEIKRLEAGNRKLRAVNADMLSALEQITNHFADVMSGPIMSRSARFIEGVEGIPTIAAARAAIRRAKGEG